MEKPEQYELPELGKDLEFADGVCCNSFTCSSGGKTGDDNW